MKNEKKEKVTIGNAAYPDLPEILSLINREAASTGALLQVSKEELHKWIKSGLSVVARANGEVVAHEAAYIWPQSGWAELRAAIVKPEFRGRGIGSIISKRLIKRLKRHKKAITIVAFGNVNSKNKAWLKCLGFYKIKYEDTPRELFTIGPKYRGQESYGYEILVLG